jgi:hypothetical protein
MEGDTFKHRLTENEMRVMWKWKKEQDLLGSTEYTYSFSINRLGTRVVITNEENGQTKDITSYGSW